MSPGNPPDGPAAVRELLGLAGSPEPLPPVTRVRTPVGLYEVRADPAATYIAIAPPYRPVPAGKHVYSLPSLAEGYYPTGPKVPTGLLGEVLGIFRAAGDIEAHVNVLYDADTSRHELYRSEVGGSATPGRVDYTLVPNTRARFVVAEFHSHHHMAAFFSATDNDAERRSGVYGVIGRIELDRPNLALRYSCGGIFRALAPSALFEPAPLLTDLIEEVTPRWPEPNR